MRLFSAAAVGAALLLAPPAAAEAETPEAAEETKQPAVTVTGAVTLASQYRFRGISLSDEEPALQGTVTVNHKSGLYAGFWGSNLDGFGELGGATKDIVDRAVVFSLTAAF